MKKFSWAAFAALLACGMNVSKAAWDDDAAAGPDAVAVVVDAGESEDKSASAEAAAEADVNVSGDGTSSYSIEVESTEETDDDSAGTDEDGQPKVRSRAKVIVVGPDGKRKVYELDGEEARNFQLQLGDGDPGEALKQFNNIMIMREGHAEKEGEGEGEAAGEEPGEERYMIGVQCDAVGDALRTQLKLGEHGLVVLDVRDETPAAEAGLKVHDIIVAINDREMESREDLIEAVTKSEGETIVLTVIREGEKHTISVTPKKMKVPIIVAPATMDETELNGVFKWNDLQGLEHMPENVRKMLEKGQGGVRLRVHPGLRIEGEMPKDAEAVRKMIDELQKEAGKRAASAQTEASKAEAAAKAHALAAEQMARRAHELAEKAEHNVHSENEKLHETLLKLQSQIEKMQQQMEILQQELEKEKSDDN